MVANGSELAEHKVTTENTSLVRTLVNNATAFAHKLPSTKANGSD